VGLAAGVAFERVEDPELGSREPKCVPRDRPGFGVGSATRMAAAAALARAVGAACSFVQAPVASAWQGTAASASASVLPASVTGLGALSSLPLQAASSSVKSA
jgi:hypothetical protein